MFEVKWDSKDLEWILDQCQNIETPFYLFDENRLRNNICYLKKKIGGKSSICFSVKANSWYVPEAAKIADYVEVCSPGEWELCRKQEVPQNKIIVGGIYKSDRELRTLVEAKPHRISIESILQLRQVNDYAAARGAGADILLRVSSGNQFGMDMDVVIDILKRQNEFPYLRFRGIHYYSGTQKRQRREIDKDIGLLEAMGRQAGKYFAEIEYGPGLGVPQFQSHKPDEYEDSLSYLIDRLQELAGQFKITLECGRLVTADTGIYVTRIVDIKTNHGREYYIVDGGIHHLQYNGQMLGQCKPLIYAGNAQEAVEKDVTICGALCTASDILARMVRLPKKKPGERLIFMNAGAYCVTEGINLFLSRNLPGILLKRQQELITVRNSIASYPLNMRQEL